MNLNKDPRYNQGIFRPINKAKFVGSFAIYRSSWEKKFMFWADKNPNVLEWSSERVIVPYKSPIDNKIHKYYVDAYVAIKEGDKVKRYLVEIKPFGQTQPPKPSKRKKPATVLYEQTQWVVNQAKWAAAREFARKKNAEFIILTEKELYAS